MKLDDYLMAEHMRAGDYDAAVFAISQHFGLGLSGPVEDRTIYSYGVRLRELRLFLPEGIYLWLEGAGFHHRAGAGNQLVWRQQRPHFAIWPNKQP